MARRKSGRFASKASAYAISSAVSPAAAAKPIASPTPIDSGEITTLPGAGTLKDNGVVVTAGQFVTVADITSGKYRRERLGVHVHVEHGRDREQHDDAPQEPPQQVDLVQAKLMLSCFH